MKNHRTYWILEPRQLRCLVSARRHDIVDRLAASGPMSIRDLATTVGAKPSALYHHVQQLLRTGLVVEAGQRVVNRKSEKLYATPAPRMRMYRALQERRNALTFKRIVGSIGRQMERDFRRGIASPHSQADGATRNLGFFRVVAAPTAATLRKVNEHLAAIGELLWERPRRGGEMICFAWTLAPVGSKGRSRRSR